ncbi:MAG: hypothetical protein ABUL60_23655 [Myxococcales bacterium]
MARRRKRQAEKCGCATGRSDADVLDVGCGASQPEPSRRSFYVPEATSWTETNLLGVFHCGQLTSGCTPGDGGTCI